MEQRTNNSVIKNPLIIVLVTVVAVSSVFYISQNKNRATPSPVTQILSHSETESANSENPTYGHVHTLFRNPVDGALLMGTHNGLFKSNDEGKIFTKVEVKGNLGTMDFMNFAYDQMNKIVYAGGHGVGVVKSTDGGVTWAKTDSGISGSDIHALTINPLDSNRLYAFSVDNGVFGTKDGAKSWYRIDDGPTNPSVRAFGYMGTPSSMDRSMKTDTTTNIGYLWAGTGGGLYSSFACFCGWTKAAGIFDEATIYTLAPDPVSRSNMFVGTKDGIYETSDEGKSFTLTNKDIKNVASIVFDQTDGKIVFAVTSGGLLYKSANSGTAWIKVN